jgi:DNA-binding protein H-NS
MTRRLRDRFAGLEAATLYRLLIFHVAVVPDPAITLTTGGRDNMAKGKPKAKSQNNSRAARSPLESLSFSELCSLKAELEKAIALRRAAERAEERAAKKSRKALLRASRLSVKYRHPSDPTLTWTGRGRRPRWITDLGGDAERFRVSRGKR